MTIRELIKQFQELDDDILDCEVWITFSSQLNEDFRITGRAKIKDVPENVDLDYKRIYLKTFSREIES